MFLNVHNELAEGSVSNIFFVKDNQLYTPDISCGLLDGIIRGWVMENFNVYTGRFTIEDMEKADECFITNSVMGIMRVNEIEGLKKFEDDRVYIKIRNKFEIIR
jgi:4-amino-4-deoxychorismate lyase